MKTGIELIQEEIKRKKEKYDYSVHNKQDAEFYNRGQLVQAALQFILGNGVRCYPADWGHPYKPKDRVTDLTKACAFLVEEIERLSKHGAHKNDCHCSKCNPITLD